MQRTSFLIAAVAVVGAGVYLPRTVGRMLHRHEINEARINHHHDIGIKTMVSYVSRPESVESMVQAADLVAVVTAGTASAGRSVRLDETDNGSPSIDFQLVDLVINEVLKGDEPAVLTLERVADVQNGRPVISHHDGGRFAPGTKHLLFLQKQPEAPFYILINDEARFSVAGDGRLSTTAKGHVADRLGGLTLPVAISLIRQMARF